MVNWSQTQVWHAPCEFLPPEDPDSCPFVPRDTDHIDGDSIGEGDCVLIDNIPSGCTGGAGHSDNIRVSTSNPNLSGGTANISVAPAELDNGDSYSFAGITIDGNGVGGSNGLTLNGAVLISVDDVTLRNFPGDGIRLVGAQE